MASKELANGRSCEFCSRLEKHLTCPICKDVFTDPVILVRCGHTYCSLCVRTTLHKKSQCPTCGKHSTTSDILINLAVAEILQDYVAEHSRGRGEKRTKDGSVCDGVREGSKGGKESTDRTAKRTRLSHVNDNLTPTKLLKQMLEKAGLPTDGNKDKLLRRYREYVNRHNANLDSICPRSHAEIVRAVLDWEHGLEASARPRKPPPYSTMESFYRPKQAGLSSPGAFMSVPSSFSALTESARATLPDPKRPRFPVLTPESKTPPPAPPSPPTPSTAPFTPPSVPVIDLDGPQAVDAPRDSSAPAAASTLKPPHDGVQKELNVPAKDLVQSIAANAAHRHNAALGLPHAPSTGPLAQVQPTIGVHQVRSPALRHQGIAEGNRTAPPGGTAGPAAQLHRTPPKERRPEEATNVGGLTPEQKRRMEANRQRALRIRRRKLGLAPP